MRRREFIAGLGSAATWPVVARAQQRGKLPTIGFLGADVTQGGARLSFSLTQRSQEFRNQPVAPHQLGNGDLFGSFEGSFRF
jgi:hypothetical protein